MTWFLVACGLFPQTAGQDAENAIQKLREEPSYRTKFRAVVHAPGSDPLVIEGESVWVKPGVLYIQYLGSGGDQKRIIRVGDKVWMYHELLGDWVTSEEMGTPGAGRGVQNPDEVLSVVRKYAPKARASGDTLEIPFGGTDIETIMKEQANAGTFDWKKSEAWARLTVKGGTLTKFSSHAKLTSLEENLKGKIVSYSADVEIVSTGVDKTLKFTVIDEATKKPVEVAIPAHIQQAVTTYLSKKP